MNMTQPMSDSETFEKLTLDAQSKKVISLRVRLSVLPYRLWLATLREISLIKILMDNYEKIPPKSLSKLIVGLFVKHASMKKLLLSLEKRLRRRVY